MQTNNKRRGKYFEDKIARKIREWTGLDEHDCYRASCSGSRQSVEFGDIIFDYRKNPVIVECKYYRDFSLEKVFPHPCSLVHNWIEQLGEESSRFEREFHEIPVSAVVVSKPRGDIFLLGEWKDIYTHDVGPHFRFQVKKVGESEPGEFFLTEFGYITKMVYFRK